RSGAPGDALRLGLVLGDRCGRADEPAARQQRPEHAGEGGEPVVVHQQAGRSPALRPVGDLLDRGPLHGGRATPSRSELPRTSTSQSWASGGSSAPKRGASETASTASTSSAVSASGEPGRSVITTRGSSAPGGGS